MQIRIYQESDEQEVIALWNAVLPDSAPHNDPVIVIRRKRAVDQDLFFVATVDEAVVGTVMGGYDGHRGWIYAVAVDPAHQRQGIGSALLRHVELALKGRGCLKVNLQVRASNAEVIAFYAALGYELEERASLGKRLYSASTALQAEAEEPALPHAVAPRDEPLFMDSLRKRPGMYVGGVNYFGFHQYLTAMIRMLLTFGATFLRLTVDGDQCELATDAVVPLAHTSDGIWPFERQAMYDKDPLDRFLIYFGHPGRDPLYGFIFNALSEELIVSITNAQQREEVHFARGVQMQQHSYPAVGEEAGTVLRFRPDSGVFTFTEFIPVVLASFFRRLSFQHPRVRFTLSVDGVSQTFYTKSGLFDLFTAVAAPYQLLHDPIRLTCEESDLKLELILAFHNGKEDYILGFVNGGLPPEGGTHEKGLKQALKRLRKRLGLTERWRIGGAIVVMGLQYNVLWAGATKNKVINPDLKKRIARLVYTQVLEWLLAHSEAVGQIESIKKDHFPDDW